MRESSGSPRWSAVPRTAPIALIAALVGVVPAAPGAAAQQLAPPPPPADSGAVVRVMPSTQYEVGGLLRFLVGENRRELWTRELTVPILDLDNFGGGLVPMKQGGNQSKTLHLEGADGRTYIFRSVDKYLGQVLPPDLENTLIEVLAQDHISAFHPGGAFIVPRFHEALDHLPVAPVYRVMPDDPRLGEYRETFAGMLGTVVERPNEGEHGEALFAGSHRIIKTETLLDKIEEHPRHRVAAEEFLSARLVDFLVGDTDRGPDQWRFARSPQPCGFSWRPIPRDRDWALVTAEGPLASLVRTAYPKLVTFTSELPTVEVLTWSDVGMGRRLLSELDAAAWDSVATTVQARLTDDVIREAVDRLPPEHQDGHADELVEMLRSRRDQLNTAARAWYRRLATEVDVRGTDLPDRAEIVRREDGTVEVTLYAPAKVMVPVVEADDGDEDEAEEYAADPYYDPDFEGPTGEIESWLPYYRRVFRPDETREVRVYLGDNDDTGVVRGRGADDIIVRLVGGEGDDALYDEAESGGRSVLYDSEGDNILVAGPRSRVDRRHFEEPVWDHHFVFHQLGYDQHRDWGSEFSLWTPALGYREGAGVIVGLGPTWTDYDFRAMPHGSRVSVRALYATVSGGFGVDLVADDRFASSPFFSRLHLRGSQFEAIRFYGYGNDSPLLPADQTLIFQEQALGEFLVGVTGSTWDLVAGPVIRHIDPNVPSGNPAASTDPIGAGPMTEAGARSQFSFRRIDDGTLPTRGVRVDMATSGYPVAGDGAGPYATAAAEARAYLTVPVLTRPVVAVRAGGRGSWGAFPLHSAAMLGGQSTLRGYRWQRFSGDAAAYGGLDLRVPLFRANLGLARGRLGVIGLTDAGRVWVDRQSPGDWHLGHGVGVYFQTLNTALYGLWARGDENRAYVGLGMPF